MKNAITSMSYIIEVVPADLSGMKQTTTYLLCLLVATNKVIQQQRGKFMPLSVLKVRS